MIRTQISLSEEEYGAAKAEAVRLGISLAELVRQSVRHMLPADDQKPWMRYAGMVETGDKDASQKIDAIVYGQKNEVYVDTSALIAFADRSDSYHALFRRLFADPPLLITTPLVIAEGHGWFLKRYDIGKGLHFLSMVETMPLNLLPVGSDEQHAAMAFIRKYSDQDLTLTDAVGLHVMASRRIRACWSTDFHLGLTKVPLAIYA